ncbi:MAG TPA: hypothetical protein VFG76_06780 [Candidatus Polarisedimenticolia bacterium]|nr:hypothetical protein [Candidatus Polarisedimenticolia bacterium]
MPRHKLENGEFCQREETEYGPAYDPSCPQCRIEEQAEPVVPQSDAQPVVIQ